MKDEIRVKAEIEILNEKIQNSSYTGTEAVELLREQILRRKTLLWVIENGKK